MEFWSQLGTVESKRDSLPHGSPWQLVIQYQMISQENTPINNIIQTEKVGFINIENLSSKMCIHVYQKNFKK